MQMKSQTQDVFLIDYFMHVAAIPDILICLVVLADVPNYLLVSDLYTSITLTITMAHHHYFQCTVF